MQLQPFSMDENQSISDKNLWLIIAHSLRGFIKVLAKNSRRGRQEIEHTNN